MWGSGRSAIKFGIYDEGWRHVHRRRHCPRATRLRCHTATASNFISSGELRMPCVDKKKEGGEEGGNDGLKPGVIHGNIQVSEDGSVVHLQLEPTLPVPSMGLPMTTTMILKTMTLTAMRNMSLT